MKVLLEAFGCLHHYIEIHPNDYHYRLPIYLPHFGKKQPINHTEPMNPVAESTTKKAVFEFCGKYDKDDCPIYEFVALE